MASTSFDKPSGASLAALLLVVAVLAGSFAPAGAQEQYAEVTLSNVMANDIRIALFVASPLPLIPVVEDFTAVLGRFDSATVQVQLPSSSMYIVAKVVGEGTIAGLTYSTGAIPMIGVTASTGLDVKFGGRCGDTSTDGVNFAASLAPLGIVDTNLNVYSACVQPQIRN